MDTAKITQAYLECAVWAGNDWTQSDGGNPPTLDAAGYTVADVTPKARAQAARVVAEFCQENERDLYMSGLADEQIGHDLWLTRNRHGAGFWDRGLPSDLGKRLTDAAHAMGEQDLMPEDGSLIFSGEEG